MAPPRFAGLLLVASILGRLVNGISIPYRPPSADVLAAEGITPPAGGFAALLAAPATGSTLNRAGWTITVDSFQPGNEGIKCLDGDHSSFWHTQWNPTLAQLPHTATIDMKAVFNVDGVAYLPRQDGNFNGNIGQHQIWVSTDGVNFGNPVAFGTWFDDATEKFAAFETIPARYIRIKALTEAGGRGPWTSAAEFNVYQAPNFTPPPGGVGKWGPTIDFPLVPVAVALQPNGKVTAWSAYTYDGFSGGNGGQTLTAIYDPGSQTVTQRLITNTGHDMFCPGISIDANGKVVVTGGNASPKTSIFDPGSNSWSSGTIMWTPRGYQASATCSDGRIFTIGGSWSGGTGGKNGEIFQPKTLQWTRLPNALVGPMITNDAQGVYRGDNHGWLFGWKNGYVFQAGPSKAMHWYNTAGTGGIANAGNRGNDNDAMCGNAVMYDAVAGKILTIGGSTSYQNAPASSNANVITIGAPGTAATVQGFSGLWFSRIFAGATVLPNGQVLITGGQDNGQPFSDAGARFTPELWDPTTLNFYKQAPNSTPRTYHSFSLLLQDGTVLVGGGGLCGTCSTNHFDAQVFTPPYLLAHDGSALPRPVITAISTTSVVPGNTITVTANGPIASMSMIRMGSATHTVNTDQRRIPLTMTNAGTNTYTVTVPNDYGIALPGYWMLFVMNAAGTPSVAKFVQVRGP